MIANLSNPMKSYKDSYRRLSQLFEQEEECIEVVDKGIQIVNYSFNSDHSKVLPGNRMYQCDRHNREFRELYRFEDREHPGIYSGSLSRADCNFDENRKFECTLFKKSGEKKSDHVILLFHGLNEKHWNKYLPWAEKLVELTGRSVLLFPIAFHMNRAPAAWGNPKQMKQISDERKKEFPSIVGSSFANAAISTRVQKIPQRFFWSGLQSYRDVIQLVNQIRAGELPAVQKDAEIDFFAYSIGSILAQIVMMTNPRELFSQSKLFIFCGGPTLDRMYPVSKYILDSEAHMALYSYFIEHLESSFKRDERLHHYFNEDHLSGTYFKSMLSYPQLKQVREDRFSELSNRIRALALKKDEVVPPGEVMNTLQGEFRDIPIKIDMLDFPFDYSHVTPFPIQSGIDPEVSEAFEEVFNKAARFFKN